MAANALTSGPNSPSSADSRGRRCVRVACAECARGRGKLAHWPGERPSQHDRAKDCQQPAHCQAAEGDAPGPLGWHEHVRLGPLHDDGPAGVRHRRIARHARAPFELITHRPGPTWTVAEPVCQARSSRETPALPRGRDGAGRAHWRPGRMRDRRRRRPPWPPALTGFRDPPSIPARRQPCRRRRGWAYRSRARRGSCRARARPPRIADPAGQPCGVRLRLERNRSARDGRRPRFRRRGRRWSGVRTRNTGRRVV